MLQKIRNSHWTKALSLYLLFSFAVELVFPTAALALTTGPSQPEVQSFSPVGTSDMVDLFSGDYSYNIPLMDVGGYPINISYNSGVTMDDEASWVGLGWNLNVGAITRNMRGLPDDFYGDEVTETTHMRPVESFSLSVTSPNNEVFGFDPFQLNYTFGITYSNYNGIGFKQSLDARLSNAENDRDMEFASLGFSLSNSTMGGASVSPTVSLTGYISDNKKRDNFSGKIGLGYSTRQGLSAMTLSFSNNTGFKNIKSKEEKGMHLTGHNGGSSISFVNSSYTPKGNLDRFNASLNFSVKVGPGVQGIDPTFAAFSGQYTHSAIANESKTRAAYGYLHNDKADPGDVLLDFNREKDLATTKNSVNIALANQTYDVFTISGQGVGGSFRPFRSDVGKVFDPSSKSMVGASGSLGLELGAGSIANVGVDGSVSGTISSEGYWDDYNLAGTNLKNKTASANKLPEGIYFKELGEKSVDGESTFLNNIGNNKAVRIPVEEAGGYQTRTKSHYVTNYSQQTYINPTTMARTERVKRNQLIYGFNGQENQFYGTNTYVSPHAKQHHLAELNVLRSDGARYVYGIAAYNIRQKEITFNATGLSGSCSNGLVSYGSSDRSEDNDNGIDHYYSETETPAYAHSFLLTSVLSTDYSDVDGVKGPSPGDLGSYTLFDYDANTSVSGIQPSIVNYGWRTPFESNNASLNEGLKSDPHDNKGNIIYGEKEVWYLNKIETKTYVAVFHKSPRQDGYEAAGIDGGKGSDALMKLDSISLYALPDYQANPTTAEPIKRVHFEYDYSQCPNVPNNSGNSVDVNGAACANTPGLNVNYNKGKLTLKRIYFTYGKSRKGKLSAYEFNYSEDHNNGGADRNKNYDHRSFDRWGSYNSNDSTECNSDGDVADNAEFPYADQNKTEANKHAVVWNLTSIKLPSGGTIRIHYEADDYSYVQDKDAMVMLKVVGSGSAATDDPTSANGRILANGSGPKTYLFFKRLGNDGNNVENYLKEMKNGNVPVYFRFMVNLGANGDLDSREYVSGYFHIEEYNIHPSQSQYFYIKVKQVPDGDSGSANSHPVSKAAWQFGRKYNSRVVYDLPDPTNFTATGVFEALANSSIIGAVFELFQGANGVIKGKGYGNGFVPEKSFVRFYNPTPAKVGGGARVNKISLTDNWSLMNPGKSDASYGQEYQYKLENGKSSGVAAYEPLIGGDENPFRKPIFIDDKLLLAPDDGNYVEEPFGETFFPSPNVGYSRVTVSNLQHANVKKHATGKVVHEFYTTKDYPTITDRTKLDMIQKKSSIAGSLLNLSLKDYLTVSQGFLIELNDMNGKPKSQSVYPEASTKPITSVKYEYQTKTEYTNVPFLNDNSISKTVLDSKVDVISPDGSVSQQEVGVDYDIINDFRKSKSYSFNVGFEGNLATFLAAILPLAVPTIFPDYSSETVEFKSVGTVKVVNRSGILKKTIAEDLGSIVSTENLAWDAQTGEVLVTRTENDFNDPVYNFTYPAHWAYEGMAQGYTNINYVCSGSIGANGQFTATTSTDLNPIEKGDEVAVIKTSLGISYSKKAWVWDLDNDPTNGIYLMDEFGSPIGTDTGILIKVIRSGRRNQQAVSIGTVTSSATPLRDNNSDGKYDAISFDHATTKILNSSAIEFSEKWGMFCNQQAKYHEVTQCRDRTALIADFSNMVNYVISQGKFCTGNANIPANLITNPVFVFDRWMDNSSNDCNSTGTMLVQVRYGGATTVNMNVYPDPWGTDLLPSGYTWQDVLAVSNFHASDKNESGTALSGNHGYIKATAYLQDGANSTNVDLLFKFETNVIAGNCGVYSDCKDGDIVGTSVNPYVLGLRGNWRALKSYLYLSDRVQTNPATNSNNLNIRKDGHYTSFAPFWKDPVGTDKWIVDPANLASWTWTSAISQYSPFGFEVENVDPLNRYSAAIYGYNNTLPKAVGANTDYRSMAYDGFEDYDFIYNNDCCKEQFNFFGNTLTNSTAHSGRYSVQIAASGVASSPAYTFTSSAPAGGADNMPYTIKSNDLIGYFGPRTDAAFISPSTSKSFIVSFWVKRDYNPANYLYSYDDFTFRIQFGATTQTLYDLQKSEIIDGWQRYEYRFVVPAATSGTVTFSFTNNNGTNNYYVDDFRIHPADASMKSFVYDPKTFRLMAELDERNFATFYEYDEEGALLRIKKETEKGIMTIQESRNNLSKYPN